MSELPQATSRRELRDREAAARARPARVSVGRALLSFSSMLVVAALAIGLSIPANAFATTSSAQAATDSGSSSALTASAAGATSTGELQTAAVSGDQAIAASRDGYQVQSRSEVLAAQFAQNTSYSYAGGRGSVRWPFSGKAPISSPFGPRDPICEESGCTDDFHHGTDFLPGDGAPIFAIANGVVVGHTENVTDLGNNVTIRHKIGKDVVTSLYGHMQAGSSPLVIGQTVHVGDFVGLVGETGVATGPHLHLGITVNGVETDPVPWMQAHVK